MPAEPMIFISHKHSDREVAETIARFLRTRSAGKVRVHLSSSPNFEGPRLGQPLNNELKRALAAAEAVILVFTTDTEDWSYCMWECGIATNPKDERPTSIVVVQCGADKPKPYGDQLRVDARDLDSVQGFVKSLLTTTDLFPNLDAPISGFAPEGFEVRDCAVELHTELAKVLPPGWGGAHKPTAPYIRFRIASQPAEELRTSYLAGATDDCLQILASSAEIEAGVGAENLFGMVLDPGSNLGDVLADWREDYDATEEPRWFWALSEQIGAALVGKLRPVKWAPYQTTMGRADVPFVAASRRIPTAVEFDVYMVPFAPRPIPVADKMITFDQMYFQDAATGPFEQVVLMALVKDMNHRNVSRLPVLDHGRPVAIIHKATINEFLVLAIDTDAVAELTLQDLLARQSDTLEDSYAVVSYDAAIEEAMAAMASKPGCQDVYVLRDGTVVGWLPNVLFIQD